MSRTIPVAWTTFQLALAGAAMWLLYETNVLGDGAAMLMVH